MMKKKRNQPKTATKKQQQRPKQKESAGRAKNQTIGTPSSSSGDHKAHQGKVKIRSKKTTTKSSRDNAGAETSGQGEKEEKVDDLLPTSPPNNTNQHRTHLSRIGNPTPTRIDTECNRVTARAETHMHKQDDLKEKETQGQEQDEELLMLSPAHVKGPCCFETGGKGGNNKETLGTASPQPAKADRAAVKGKHGKGKKR